MKRLVRTRRRVLLDVPTEISLTPLIDTALTLLIIFMVTTPMMHNAIKVALPKGNSKETDIKNDELIIVITKDGILHCGDKTYTKPTLVDYIVQQKKEIGCSTIVVKADQEASYGMVIDVVDHLKHIEGITYVALAMEKRS